MDTIEQLVDLRRNRPRWPHEYVFYPGEGHGFRRREHRGDCYTRMIAWVRKYLAE